MSVIIYNIRATKSTVVNFAHNSDFMLKLSSIGLRAKRSDNFMPRVMRKRLRAHFHNFGYNFAVLANREPSCHFGVIELNGQVGQITRVVEPYLRANFNNFYITLTPSN